ncbi:hypothetical protein H7347_10375 [Corynebacterium sp. zg-331]|uniref:hypothetical protein n=1 Tax=unclassified Corynebacterium TaxID=2624378 RepID=UPI00128B1DCB|nr:MULTISPECIES: hypothetical protein [unclassified Corynebacterium]MBC3186962.1 hypothetical protein [Corynebacterium sp. zg-331]MPV53439.1 hypothetical protein [Corynebacterium sp. zg331]
MDMDDVQAMALAEVKRAQRVWEEERAAAAQRRRDSVLKALDAGLSMTSIGAAMGLSRERIAQIRDGRDR